MHTTTTKEHQRVRPALGLAWLALGLCSALLAGLAEARAAVTVKAARLGSTADAQRIVIELAAPVSYKYFTLGNPHRLVVDLDDVDPAAEALKQLTARIAGNDPYVAEIRVAQNRPGVTRLVAGLKAPMRPLVSLLPAISGFGPRLVIDLVPGGPATALAEPAPATARIPATTAEAPRTGQVVTQTPTPASTPAARDSAQAVRQTVDATPPTATPAAQASIVKARPAEPEKFIASDAPPGGEKPTPGGAAATEQAMPPSAANDAKPREKPGASDKAATKILAVTDKPVETPAPAAEAALTDKTRAGAKPVSLEKQVEQAIRQSERIGDSESGAKAGKKKTDAYKRLVTVAIDAGHGGVDPGALGANGSREKDITLAVARRLKEHLDKREGMRGVLTRDGDYFIPLHERVAKARRAQADLFVSIHADAFLKTSAKGSSVFALSEKGASSAAARWLAKRENDADLIGGVNIDVKDVYLKQTLLDLSQTATIADSLKLGKAVLDELGEINDLHKTKVEQASFAVLKAPDIPSILVETAFISNPDEEKRLLDEDYQEKMASAIVNGIRAYFDANPPLARAKVAQAD